MTAGAGLDLSGRWRGIFNYPGQALPPTEFEAELRDHGGLLSGVTAEPHFDGSGTLVHASIEGTRERSHVQFRKTYDDLGDDYARVDYEGDVDPSGDEIGGRWTVSGAWSGTFLMVRASRSDEAAEQRTEAKV